MTIETWKAEFYPVEASTLNSAPLIDAIDHCLVKWEGLRSDNVAKHGMASGVRGKLYDPSTGQQYAPANGPHCALCLRFINDNCAECPIADDMDDEFTEGCNGEYREYINNNNPEPMISSLTRAKETLLAKEAVALVIGALPPPFIYDEPPRSRSQELDALSVVEAMQLARKVLAEIGTTGGKYGHLFGDIVADSSGAEYALRSAMNKLGSGGR